MSDPNLEIPRVREASKGLYTQNRARRSLIHTAGLRAASKLATMLGFLMISFAACRLSTSASST